MPDETTPILHHVRRRTTGNTDYDSLNDSGRPSRQDSRVLQSRRSSFHFMKRRTGAYDEDSQGLINENTGIRVWYENYSSIGKRIVDTKPIHPVHQSYADNLLMF
jgi:hypothetical protein